MLAVSGCAWSLSSCSMRRTTRRLLGCSSWSSRRNIDAPGDAGPRLTIRLFDEEDESPFVGLLTGRGGVVR